MLVSISESFQSGLLDGQMATAYLTGIVAETDRFSNEKTSPKVMTMSAQLMAAGANQQLIATQLNPVVEADLSGDLPAPVESEEVLPPNEAVLDLHHEDDNIHTDEQGDMNSHEELAQAVNEVQENAVSPHRTIQPLPPETEFQPESEMSKYITEPPANGGTLTASAEPESYDPSIDPLSEPENHGYETQEHEKSVVSPLIGITDDAESVQAASMPSTETPLLPSDGETGAPDEPAHDLNNDIPSATDEFESDIPVIDKLGPDVHEQDTLTEIEHAVQDFSGVAPHSEPPEMPSVPAQPATDDVELSTDAARQAVMDAVEAGGFDATRPEPIQALNAQEFPQSPPQIPEVPVIEPLAPPTEPIVSAPAIEPTMPPAPLQDAPPSVPPPMLPQFPIPGAEVYEPDQDPRNNKN
jgi:hypothetical protein